MLVVDVETTSLNPWTSSILSIGAVSFEHPEDTFYRECHVDAGADISKEAMAVNGFTAEQIADPSKPTSAECVSDFLKWVTGAGRSRGGIEVLVGQNPAFDRYCILTSCERNGFTFPFQHRLVDLHSVYCTVYVQENGRLPESDSRFNLEYILGQVGLPSRSGAHNALDDAKLEAEALSRLLFRKNLMEEYREFPTKLPKSKGPG